MATDIKCKIKSLYEIMIEEKIQELEINSKEYSICIKRKDCSDRGLSATEEKRVTTVDKIEKKEVFPLMETIKSPITGVFYLAPSPLSPVFVSNGDIVEVGGVLCIVEAMKAMNEIKAAFKIKIVKILVENGKAVDAGQDLFSVEKMDNAGVE
ncbi:MAG: hypothetical protein LBU29_00815 [Endomicrobium sp.]|jgi:biotin carboxyl carrier protein|nr:hypothetical protein [Endomicrobium sp.]